MLHGKQPPKNIHVVPCVLRPRQVNVLRDANKWKEERKRENCVPNKPHCLEYECVLPSELPFLCVSKKRQQRMTDKRN